MHEKGIVKDIHKGAIALALFLLLCYTASFGARYFWFFDLLRHFVFQYFIGATLLGLFLIWRKSRIWSMIMFSVALLTAYESISIIHKPNLKDSGRIFKIAIYNKLYFASNHDQMIDWIQQESPDILIIQEADSESSKRVKELSAYPYSMEKIQESPFSFIFLSKFPITERFIGETQKHVLNNIYGHALIQLSDDITISIHTAHPVPPVSYIHNKQRNSDINFMANLIKEDSNKNILFIGDFNITPYSPFFKDMIKKTNLKNEYTSVFPLPTWPSVYYDYIFQIPIDHILHKGDLQLIDKHRGPDMSSDHYPLIATFVLQ